jgi:hypothetical protein
LAQAMTMTMTAVMNFAAWASSPQASGSSQASARLLRGGPRSAPGKVAKLWSRLTKTLQKLRSLVAKIRTTLGISSITLTLGTPWTISIAVEF